MTDSPPRFPLPCRDIQTVNYTSVPLYLLVLRGGWSPPERPIFTRVGQVPEVVVDDQGLWGSFEWSLLPQVLDSESPWLANIPIYHDRNHISRSVIPPRSITSARRVDANYHEKQPPQSTLQADLAQQLREYTTRSIESAKSTYENLQHNKNLRVEDGVRLAGMTEAMDRAKYLIGRILSGLPSSSSCKRAIACLRRVILELESFTMWGTLMLTDVADQRSVASTYKEQNRLEFRGAFLDATKEEWLEEGSVVRRRYEELMRWRVPIYSLVRVNDWTISPFRGLPVGAIPFHKEPQIGKRDDTLPVLCYPPKVDARSFERAARGHGFDGWQQQADTVTAKRSRRDVTEGQQRMANDPWRKAVANTGRPHPDMQARINSKNGPPAFMSYWRLSDALATWTPDRLAPSPGGGTFLPRPGQIWSSERKQVMLETLTIIWKLLVLRPCLFRQGELTAKEAYLSAQGWRDILKRIGSDSSLPVMWAKGKPELWGSRLVQSIQQRASSISADPTLKRMDCCSACSPLGKFDNQHDPLHHLEHFVMFRLMELHVLHDFASYHPHLQRKIDGRWCPPPFDAQDALDDRPGAFAGLTLGIDEKETAAMEEIVGVVRWNGIDGQRPWEMEDGISYRDWLTAFRTLLSKCSNAWVDNPVLEMVKETSPGLDLLTCDLQQPSLPAAKVARLLIGTHLLLAMRTGRLPWLWFNKPVLNSFACIHD